jgi:glycogen operon protein
MARVLAVTLGATGEEPDLHVIFNMYDLALDFALPPMAGRRWLRLVDTARVSPEDILDPDRALPVSEDSYLATGHSVVVLMAE